MKRRGVGPSQSRQLLRCIIGSWDWGVRDALLAALGVMGFFVTSLAALGISVDVQSGVPGATDTTS